MTNKYRLLLLTSILLCHLTLTATAQVEAPVVPNAGIEGRIAPEIVVDEWIQLPAGKDNLSINDYKGKALIIYCFQDNLKEANQINFPKLSKLVENYKGNDQVGFVAVQLVFKNVVNNIPARLKDNADAFGLNDIPFGHHVWTPQFPGMGGGKGNYKIPYVPWYIAIGPDGMVKYNGKDIDVEHAIKQIDELIK